MQNFFIAVLALMFAQALKADESYLCQSELASGIIKDGKIWGEATFNLLKFPMEQKDNFRYVQINGYDYECTRPDIEKIPNSYLCNTYFGFSFRFNSLTGRYIHITSSMYSYLENSENTDTDILYAGSCEKL